MLCETVRSSGGDEMMLAIAHCEVVPAKSFMLLLLPVMQWQNFQNQKRVIGYADSSTQHGRFTGNMLSRQINSNQQLI